MYHNMIQHIMLVIGQTNHITSLSRNVYSLAYIAIGVATANGDLDKHLGGIALLSQPSSFSHAWDWHCPEAEDLLHRPRRPGCKPGSLTCNMSSNNKYPIP